MWQALVIVLAACAVGLHVWWYRRFKRLQKDSERKDREAAAANQDSREAVARELARQEAMINSMVEGLLILDRDSRVRWVNRSLEASFELSTHINGRTIMEAFRLRELRALAQRAKAEGRVIGFELSLPGRNPKLFQVNATDLRDPDGQSQGMVLVFHDVTRLKQLENTRQEFVANVSHELRTPLSIIKGNAETLLDGAMNDPAVATRFLQAINKHADRLSFLIEDLLTISRLESGQVALNLQAVDLFALTKRVLEDLEARAVERHVSLSNDVAEGLSACADSERLQQVLFNLVDNAIKYGRAEGSVSVGGKAAPESQIELWVKDDGPGIPPEAKDRVFERFFRVDRSRSRDQGGTGLGLAIVKHIVQSHGGKVWVRSEFGHGAEFYVTLPAWDPNSMR